MKKTFISLGFWGLLLVAPRLNADVSVDFFYNNLSGGSWVDVADYGYCWQPDVAVGNDNWRPYSDGYWAYTDLGWTWVSYEDFGWATYHYGRWALLDDYGWVWVPGRDADLEWGPAWVSWRTGGEYIGWAPLPPETINVVEGRPLTGHLDIEFNIGPAYYNFVDVRYIGEPVLRERIIAPVQNITCIQQTVNVTNITYKNKTVYNYGPDINVVNRTAARPIQRLRLDRQQNVDAATAAKSGGLTKVQGDRLVVAAPMHINRAAGQVAPPSVKTKVATAKINRGWSAAGDERAQAALKERIKTQSINTVAPLGAGPAGQGAAASNAGAAAGGNAVVPTQTGQGMGQGRRGQRGAGAMAGTSPNPVQSPVTNASPAQGFSTDAESGKGRRGQGQEEGRQQHNRFPQATEQASPVIPQSSTETATGAGPADTGVTSGRQGQGGQQFKNGDQGARNQGQGQERQGRRFQNQDRNNFGGQGAAGGQGQGQQGQRFQNQQAPPAQAEGQAQGQGASGRQGMRPGGGERPQGQGEGQGQGQGHRGGKRGDANPSATPQ